MSERVHDYHDGNRYFHDRFDTRRLADRIAASTSDHMDHPAQERIEQADMFFLATCDHRGLPTCSYKGGDPGFVRVVDAYWLAFPNYDGNGKYQICHGIMSLSRAMQFSDFLGFPRPSAFQEGVLLRRLYPWQAYWQPRKAVSGKLHDPVSLSASIDIILLYREDVWRSRFSAGNSLSPTSPAW